MWFDEVFSWHTSQNDVKQIVIITSGDIHPPLFYVALKYWTAAFGDSVFAMRMLSVLLNMLSIIFLLKICKRLHLDEKQKLFALFLYAITPLNIYYSQEIRMQSLSLFLTMGSVYFFIRSLDKNNWKTSLCYIVFTFLSFYTHYFTILIFAAQIIYVVYSYIKKEFDKKILLRHIINFILPVILFTPWIKVLLEQVSKGQPWRKQQDIFQVFVEFLKYFNDFIFSTYHNFATLWTEIIIYTFSVVLISSIVYFIFKLFKNEQDQQNEKYSRYKLLAFLISFPLIFAFILSFRQSIIFSRYLSTLVPYICIIIPLVIYKITAEKRKYLVAALITFMLFCGLYNNYYNSWKYNDYRDVINFIRDNSKENEKQEYKEDSREYPPNTSNDNLKKNYLLIADPHYLGWVIKYESLHSNNSINKPEVFGWDLPMQMDSLKERTDINNLWVVLDYSTMDKRGYEESDLDLQTLGYKKITEKYFYIYPEKVKVAEYKK